MNGLDRWTIAAAGVLAALPMGCAHTAATGAPRCPGPVDGGEVRRVLETQAAAWNEGDIDGFMEGYEASPALLFTSGGRVRRGFVETREKYRDRYGSDPSSMGHLTFVLLDVRRLGVCGDAAVVLGRWELAGGGADGRGVFSVVLEHGADGWRIVHDHTSSDPAPD